MSKKVRDASDARTISLAQHLTNSCILPPRPSAWDNSQPALGKFLLAVCDDYHRGLQLAKIQRVRHSRIILSSKQNMNTIPCLSKTQESLHMMFQPQPKVTRNAQLLESKGQQSLNVQPFICLPNPSGTHTSKNVWVLQIGLGQPKGKRQSRKRQRREPRKR